MLQPGSFANSRTGVIVEDAPELGVGAPVLDPPPEEEDPTEVDLPDPLFGPGVTTLGDPVVFPSKVEILVA
jgi:hypothetical protein